MGKYDDRPAGGGREAGGREANPGAAIIDSRSVMTREKEAQGLRRWQEGNRTQSRAIAYEQFNHRHSGESRSDGVVISYAIALGRKDLILADAMSLLITEAVPVPEPNGSHLLVRRLKAKGFVL